MWAGPGPELWSQDVLGSNPAYNLCNLGNITVLVKTRFSIFKVSMIGPHSLEGHDRHEV